MIRSTLFLIVPFAALVLACSSSGSSAVADAGSQTPPQGGTQVEAWLKTGAYNSWHCEPAVHASRKPSVHGFNRICSNDIIASNAAAASDWPEGAAAVKELYSSLTATSPDGYAVYLKTESASAGGANWYWYERVPLDSTAPHDSAGVVGDGLGNAGVPKTLCVACHGAAGSDAAHTPSTGGRDFVYTPVH
jgi:hypothetical protein